MATNVDRGGYQPKNPTPLEAEDLTPPALGSWIGNRVEPGAPAASIDDIVCRNMPASTFPVAKMHAVGWFRFSVDVFICAYEPPKVTPLGYQGPTWTLRPSGKPTIEEIPEDPHAAHS